MTKKKRVWVFSDTHTYHRDLIVPPNIDVAICAGDIGSAKDLSYNDVQVADFMNWYESLGIKHKILVPGNHDTSIEADMLDQSKYPSVAVLLHDIANINGLQVFGSPYTPAFCDWAYNLKDHKLIDAWACIPKGVDVVITHGPPYGQLDESSRKKKIGCKHLLAAIEEIKPKYHVFGHNHNDNSSITNNGHTTFINASVLDETYTKVTNGVVFSV